VIGVTGATGHIGGMVARGLHAAGVPQRLIVRDPSRAPRLEGAEVVTAGYVDTPALLSAFDGIDVLLLVSASEAADRVALHTATVDAAVAAGVRRIVYTSFLRAAPDATFTFARDHWSTEQHIRASGAAYTFLRDNMYLDLIPHWVGDDGVIRGPAGDGRVGAVARADVASSAVAALTGAGHEAATYDLTGPESISLARIAAQLSEARGRPIRYRAETLDEAYRSRERYGAPSWEVAGWVTSYAAIASGELDVVTNHVEQLTGHPPMSLGDLLAGRTMSR
jgi:NAD(P)H dehydrogenase (quinone)